VIILTMTIVETVLFEVNELMNSAHRYTDVAIL
jgi:hypothetical protein